MQKLISIDIFSDFGMLKKPDTNEPVYLTFNMLHKPAFLGIIGAIIGEKGFEELGVLPIYYKKLKDLKVSYEPLYHENGSFQKTIISYNNTTGMASKEAGGNLMISEQTLIAPAFRCFILIDMEDETHVKIDHNLSNYQAEYLPYLGKNEFSVWWKNYRSHDNYERYSPSESFRIRSVFIKNEPIAGKVDIQPITLNMNDSGNTFSYFERLPIKYKEIAKAQFQYEYKDFVLTDWLLETRYEISFELLSIEDYGIIQVF